MSGFNSQRLGARCALVPLCMSLVACGGWEGSSDGPAPTPEVVTQFAISTQDNFAFTGALQGNGSGVWLNEGGGGADSGDGDAGGAAGDGEFVKVNMRFPGSANQQGKLTWTVVRSQFGLAGQTGQLTIAKDAAGEGGYKVTAVNGVETIRASQSNFFLSASGQLCGSLPLPIGASGAVRDVLFNGVRFKDGVSTAADLSEFAGTYTFGFLAGDAGTGQNRGAKAGVLKFDASGAGRLCLNTVSWSASCADGLDANVSFNDPKMRNVIRIRTAPSQSLPIAAGTRSELDILAVARKFGMSGVSLSGDYLATAPGLVATTGALYASRQEMGALSPMMAVGAWNYVGSMISSMGVAPVSTKLAIADVKGTVQMAASVNGDPSLCAAQASTLGVGTVNGVIALNNPMLMTHSYMMMLDTDLALVVMPGLEVGLARRYDTNPAVAPCQPSAL